jgi:hypothetical protein
VERVAVNALTALGHVLGIHRGARSARSRRAWLTQDCADIEALIAAGISNRYVERRAVFRRPSGAKSTRAKRKRANPPSPNSVTSRNVIYSDANSAM